MNLHHKGREIKLSHTLIRLVYSVILLSVGANAMDIARIRELYHAIESNKAFYQVQMVDESGGNEHYIKRYYTDSNGIVRLFFIEGGSEDSGFQGKYYYTQSGRLFFSYITHDTVHGCGIELRNYIDAHRIIRRLKKVHRCDTSIPLPETIYYPRSYK